MHSPQESKPKKSPLHSKKTKHTKGESENANSFPRGQPPKRTQNTWLKAARFQKGQNRTHLTSEFGETVSGVFRTGNPIHILKFPVLQGLLDAQKSRTRYFSVIIFRFFKCVNKLSQSSIPTKPGEIREKGE